MRYGPNCLKIGTGAFYCAKCRLHWGHGNLAHCGRCCRTFSNSTGLDRHAAGDGSCIRPNRMRPRYEKDNRGIIWQAELFEQGGNRASKTNE